MMRACGAPSLHLLTCMQPSSMIADFIEDVRKAHDPFANAPARPGGPKPMYPRGVQYG